MKFEEALNKMEKLGRQHFPKYTIDISKHCDGDFKIEVIYAIKEGYLHKFVYYNYETGGFYRHYLNYQEDAIIECIEKPVVGGGLGCTETVENGILYLHDSIGLINKIDF